MDYRAALDYILSFADYERNTTLTRPTSGRPSRFDLERVEAFLARIGDPQRKVPAVHIAGTRGKGSTAAMIASILAASGRRVGLYTSPHLHDFRERIRIGDQLIAPEQLAALVDRLRLDLEAFHASTGDRLTTFELITTLAFCFFAEQQVDVQVLETGLGGRLDATNVVRPLVATLTSISLDHTNLLGKTVRSIAAEKAGIVKSGSVAVTSPQQPDALEVIAAACEERGVPLVRVGRDVRYERDVPGKITAEDGAPIGQELTVYGRRETYRTWLPLLGEHQAENAAAAVATVEVLAERGLPVEARAIETGIRQVSWPGRLQLIHRRPLVVADGAQNGYSARRLLEALADHFVFRRLILVVGVTWPVLGLPVDKNVRSIAAALGPEAALVICCPFHHPRALDPDALAAEFALQGAAVETADSADVAFDSALAIAEPEDLICVTGSLFLVAEALRKWEEPTL